MATEPEVRAAIAAERRELAALLRELPEESWDAPSLCAGWRVREMVAHITMPFRYSLPRFILALVRARGDFNRMADQCARQDAAKISPAELAATLERNTAHPWKPPGSGYEAALFHDVIHGLDITVALGLERQVPADRLRIVLESFETKQVREFFDVDVAGIELRADDLDWSFGAGPPVSGSAQDLALVLGGRKLPPHRLRGEPAGRFTAG